MPMGNTTITIKRGEDPSYDPSNIVHRGDQVTFQLDNVPYEVEIDFDDGCPFSAQPPYYLNGTSLTTSSKLETVATNALTRPYSFNVTIFDGTTARGQDGVKSKLGGELETKKGGIDVSPEPPKDPKKK